MSFSASSIGVGGIDPHFVYGPAGSNATKTQPEPRLGQYFDFFYDREYITFLFAIQFTQFDENLKITETFYAGLKFDDKTPENARVAVYNKRMIKQFDSRTLDKPLPQQIIDQLNVVRATYQRKMAPETQLTTESPIESAASTPSTKSITATATASYECCGITCAIL